jgi:hypothetical protein
MKKGAGLTIVLGGGPRSEKPKSGMMDEGPEENEGDEEYTDAEGESAAAMRLADALGVDTSTIDPMELASALKDFVQTCC